MDLILRFKRAYNTYKNYKEPKTFSFSQWFTSLLLKTKFTFGYFTFFENTIWWYRGMTGATPEEFAQWWCDLTLSATTVYTPWDSYRGWYIDDPDDRLSGEWYEIYTLTGQDVWCEDSYEWVPEYVHLRDEWIAEDGTVYVVEY